MKRFFALVLALALICSAAACADTPELAPELDSIKTYQDIPGVTEEEITAIEALKNGREYFSYGQMEETEAFILPDGTYGGFAASFCALLSRLFETDFVLELHDWEDLKSGIDNKQIDFTGDLTPTSDRLRQYHMTHTIAERSLRIYQYSESDELLLEKDINGLTVGSLTGTIDIEHVNQSYPELVFYVVEVSSFDEAAQMLKSGAIDIFITEGVIDPVFDQYGFIKSKEFFPLVYTPVSLTTMNPELSPIIDVVNKYLAIGGIDTLFDLYNDGNKAYAYNKLGKLFTEEEQAYLREMEARGSPVRIAMEQDNYPVCFYNESDREFQGIAVDALSEIGELTGLTFEIINDLDAPWKEIMEMLKTGEASMVSQLLYSDERKGLFLWPDHPYASSYYALISKTEYPNLASYQVVRARVGVIKDSAFEDKYYEWFPGNDNVITYNDQDELLDALENGDIDLLMGSNYLLLMQQNYRENPGFKINLRFSAPMESYFGFNVNETRLCSIIGKAQSFVNINAISEDWTSRGYDYAKKLAQHRSQYFLGIAATLLVLLSLMVFFLIKNRKINQRLDRMVNEVTLDLRESVAKLQAVITNYSGVIWSVDRERTITLFNGLYLKEIGVTPDFLEGKKLAIARTKNRHLDIIEHVENSFAEGTQQDWISEVDGKMFLSRIAPIFAPDGNVSGLVGNIDDITESLRLQNELKEALQKAETAIEAVQAAQLTVSAMFDSNPQMNLLFDDSLKVIDCNPAACAFLGFASKKEFVDGFAERFTKSLPKFQSDGRVTLSLPERMLEAATKGYAKFETEVILDSAMRILNVEMIRIPYGSTFAIVAYVFDMTEIREREKELIRRDQQLQDAVREAEAANRAKTSFLSTMSHEIRTPMNAILGITEIQLQNESLDNDVKEALNKVYISGDLLLGIINDILDLSKIDAGKLEIVTDKYEIASLISDTAQLNMMRIGSKPIEFELNVNENLPIMLMGDSLRVKQILNNVLSNAFKYTGKGTVSLAVAAETDHSNEDGVTMVFSVSDTGQGMTQEQVAKLFEEYTRFNMDVNRSTEGTGLGMTITRNLIRLMNGSIHVESEPGQGTTVTMRLPQGRTGSEVLGREMAENLHQFRTSSRTSMKRVQITREPMPYGSVLIVDDVETNIYVAKGLLTPYGLKIDSAESGFAAVEKVKDGKSYDIVFMDHMMPKMDGIETTKVLRGMGYERSIVALTANAVAGQAEIFLGNGFDDYISKPIDIRQLNAVLNKLIRDKKPPEVVAAARKQALEQKEQSPSEAAPAIDPQFAEIFARDASKALTTLEAIAAKDDYSNEDDLRSYIINVHGIKSALANIGKMDLSAVALKLETAGREGKLDIITGETGAFLSSLRAYVEELTPKEEVAASEPGDEDKTFLREKLLAIQAACEEFDESAAEAALAELRNKAWTRRVSELLGAISEQLLHSDFDEIAEGINKYLEE